MPKGKKVAKLKKADDPSVIKPDTLLSEGKLRNLLWDLNEHLEENKNKTVDKQDDEEEVVICNWNKSLMSRNLYTSAEKIGHSNDIAVKKKKMKKIDKLDHMQLLEIILKMFSLYNVACFLVDDDELFREIDENEQKLGALGIVPLAPLKPLVSPVASSVQQVRKNIISDVTTKAPNDLDYEIYDDGIPAEDKFNYWQEVDELAVTNVKVPEVAPKKTGEVQGSPTKKLSEKAQKHRYLVLSSDEYMKHLWHAAIHRHRKSHTVTVVVREEIDGEIVEHEVEREEIFEDYEDLSDTETEYSMTTAMKVLLGDEEEGGDGSAAAPVLESPLPAHTSDTPPEVDAYPETGDDACEYYQGPWPIPEDDTPTATAPTATSPKKPRKMKKSLKLDKPPKGKSGVPPRPVSKVRRLAVAAVPVVPVPVAVSMTDVFQDDTDDSTVTTSASTVDTSSFSVKSGPVPVVLDSVDYAPAITQIITAPTSSTNHVLTEVVPDINPNDARHWWLYKIVRIHGGQDTTDDIKASSVLISISLHILSFLFSAQQLQAHIARYLPDKVCSPIAHPFPEQMHRHKQRGRAESDVSRISLCMTDDTASPILTTRKRTVPKKEDLPSLQTTGYARNCVLKKLVKRRILVPFSPHKKDIEIYSTADTMLDSDDLIVISYTNDPYTSHRQVDVNKTNASLVSKIQQLTVESPTVPKVPLSNTFSPCRPSPHGVKSVAHSSPLPNNWEAQNRKVPSTILFSDSEVKRNKKEKFMTLNDSATFGNAMQGSDGRCNDSSAERPIQGVTSYVPHAGGGGVYDGYYLDASAVAGGCGESAAFGSSSTNKFLAGQQRHTRPYSSDGIKCSLPIRATRSTSSHREHRKLTANTNVGSDSNTSNASSTSVFIDIPSVYPEELPLPMEDPILSYDHREYPTPAPPTGPMGSSMKATHRQLTKVPIRKKQSRSWVSYPIKTKGRDSLCVEYNPTNRHIVVTGPKLNADVFPPRMETSLMSVPLASVCVEELKHGFGVDMVALRSPCVAGEYVTSLSQAAWTGLLEDIHKSMVQRIVAPPGKQLKTQFLTNTKTGMAEGDSSVGLSLSVTDTKSSTAKSTNVCIHLPLASHSQSSTLSDDIIVDGFAAGMYQSRRSGRAHGGILEDPDGGSVLTADSWYQDTDCLHLDPIGADADNFSVFSDLSSLSGNSYSVLARRLSSNIHKRVDGSPGRCPPV